MKWCKFLRGLKRFQKNKQKGNSKFSRVVETVSTL